MENIKGFTLVEILVALVILGVIIIVAIVVPNQLIEKQASMTWDSDLYSDTMLLTESLSKDIMNITSRKDIEINNSGKTINNIKIKVNSFKDDNFKTDVHTYYFKEDGVYMSTNNSNSKKLTNNQFFRFPNDDENLLTLGVQKEILDEESNSVKEVKDIEVISFNLIGNSLQKKSDINYNPVK